MGVGQSREIEELNISDNPVCGLTVLRPFVAHTFQRLKMFNGVALESYDRDLGRHRFGALDALAKELSAMSQAGAAAAAANGSSSSNGASGGSGGANGSSGASTPSGDKKEDEKQRKAIERRARAASLAEAESDEALAGSLLSGAISRAVNMQVSWLRVHLD